MSYEEFILSFKENLSQYFIDEKENCKINMVTSHGVNDTNNDCIQVWRGEEQLGVLFRLSPLYEQYIENGQKMDAIINETAAIIRNEESKSIPSVENILSMVSDWDKVKSRISCKLINREENKTYLQDKPYTNFQDLAVIYKIILERNSEGVSGITLTNHMLSIYGVSKQELHAAAVSNLKRENKATITPLWDLVAPLMRTEERNLYQEEMPNEKPDYFLVLSNRECIDGAAEIMNPEIQERIADKMGGDYFVLPSSVHELIAVKKTYPDMDYKELQENVKTINETCVLPEERLSDKVYEYNAKTKKLTICGEERIREQEHPLSQAERDGLELAFDYGLTDDLKYTGEELQQTLEQRQEIEREKKHQERSIRHGRR